MPCTFNGSTDAVADFDVEDEMAAIDRYGIRLDAGLATRTITALARVASLKGELEKVGEYTSQRQCGRGSCRGEHLVVWR